jgi:hypothetical protein
MPAGAVTPATAASSSIEPRAASLDIPLARLRRGTNLLAASVHNVSAASSDLSFAAVLLPPAEKPGGVNCNGGFRRGDASPDGVVDLSDAVRILLYLFGGPGGEVCADAADVDDDGAVRVTDAIALLNYLFRGGAPPPAPGAGPSCGADPTGDGLAECGASACGG